MDDDPEELRRRADHFRQLAILVMDDRAHDAALRLAREYDELAETIAHEGALGVHRALEHYEQEQVA